MPLYGKRGYTERYVRYFSAEAPRNVKLLLFDADHQLEKLKLDVPDNVVLDSILMDGSPGTYAKSMCEMLSRVTTEFAMLNDNDDFPYFPGVVEAMKRLESDSSIEWVGGNIGHFFRTPFGRQVFLRDKTGRGHRTILEKLTNKYQYEWYNVFRSSTLKNLFEKMIDSCPVEWKHLEIFQTLYCSLLRGTYLDNYIYFREVFVKNSSASLSRAVGIHEDFIRSAVGILCRINEANLERSEIEPLLRNLLLKFHDRRRMYAKLFMQIVLAHWGALDWLDRELAEHSEFCEADFRRASGLSGQYYVA